MKKLLTVLLAILCLVSVSGCSKTEEPTPETDEGEKQIRIGVAHISMYDSWCKLIYDEFEKQAAEYGYVVDIQNAAGDEELQANQIETFITMGYDMIMVDPCSYDGICATLEKCTEAGIPVIAFDADTSYEGLVTHCAQNHEELGTICADYIADYAEANLDGKVSVGVIYAYDGEQTICRGVAFEKELEERLGKENITYVFQQDYSTNNSVEGGANIVETYIGQHMDFVWCATDNGAIGASQALENAGITDTMVLSSDGWGDQSFGYIYEGNHPYSMCIACSPVEIVKSALACANAYFNGQREFERHNWIDLRIVDKTTASEFAQYIDPEYLKTLTKGEDVQ